MGGTVVISQGVMNAITIIERIGSVFSLIGCLFIIVTFVSSSGFRKPINRLVFYASFGNMLVNIGTLIARAYVHEENSVGCQLQGFLIQQFLPSDALWALAMAFNVYLTFYHKFDAHKLRKMEKWYLLICYGIPFPPALGYIFISTKEKGRIYGNATLWCWVGNSWDILRIATFYGPVWVIISATFFIYLRAGREIYMKRRQLRKIDSDSNPGLDLDVVKLDDIYPMKTTEIRVTSETVASTSEKGEIAPPRPSESRRASEPQGDAAYSITISSNREAPAPMPSQPPNPTNPNQLRHVAQAKAKRKRNHEFSTAAWAYSKCAILFFTALLVTWIPSSANRVYSVIHTGETVVALEILSAIVLPLQGFWNAIIYCVTSWAAVKMFFSDVRHRVGYGGNSGGLDYAGPSSKGHHSVSFHLKKRDLKGEDTDSMTELAGNAIPISKFS
ncbi:G-protein coupled receptor [Nemania sp. FL0916]|nr:G-protein coupled receptor [Nemania sp. FL0916]